MIIQYDDGMVEQGVTRFDLAEDDLNSLQSSMVDLDLNLLPLVSALGLVSQMSKWPPKFEILFHYRMPKRFRKRPFERIMLEDIETLVDLIIPTRYEVHIVPNL